MIAIHASLFCRATRVCGIDGLYRWISLSVCTILDGMPFFPPRVPPVSSLPSCYHCHCRHRCLPLHPSRCHRCCQAMPAQYIRTRAHDNLTWNVVQRWSERAVQFHGCRGCCQGLSKCLWIWSIIRICVDSCSSGDGGDASCALVARVSLVLRTRQLAALRVRRIASPVHDFAGVENVLSLYLCIAYRWQGAAANHITSTSKVGVETTVVGILW
jgi:hypothetical protein